MNCKIENNWIFLIVSKSQKSSFLGLWNIKHGDLKVLPQELTNSRMCVQPHTTLRLKVHCRNPSTSQQNNQVDFEEA